MRIFVMLAWLAFMVGALPAVAAAQGGALADAPAPGALRVTDDTGAGVRLARPARRIVSLSPALTESVCVLGGCERLVGVDRFASWPDTVKSLPRLDGQGQGSVESVLALRPDLVLMADGEQAWRARLQAMGVPVLVLAPTRLDDVRRVLQRLALVLGKPEAHAEAAWSVIGHDLQKLAESLPCEARGWRTWLEIDPAPWLAGPDSFMGEMLTKLGLGNVLDTGAKAFVRVNPEWVFQAAPDLLMVSDHGRGGLDALQRRPGWSRLPALKDGRVCLFAGDALDTLVRPGPRVADGARQMLACVQRLVRPAPAAGAPASRPLASGAGR